MLGLYQIGQFRRKRARLGLYLRPGLPAYYQAWRGGFDGPGAGHDSLNALQGLGMVYRARRPGKSASSAFVSSFVRCCVL